jgi:hypothetical protein
MVAKKYAISAPSAAIAMRYGKNVSKGILKMEGVIKANQIIIDLLRAERKARRATSGPSVRKLK